jgi:hypothetical protein
VEALSKRGDQKMERPGKRRKRVEKKGRCVLTAGIV